MTGTGNFSGTNSLGVASSGASLNAQLRAQWALGANTDETTVQWNASGGATVNIAGLTASGGSYSGAGTYNLSGTNTLQNFTTSTNLNITGGATTLAGTNLLGAAVNVGDGATARC